MRASASGARRGRVCASRPRAPRRRSRAVSASRRTRPLPSASAGSSVSAMPACITTESAFASLCCAEDESGAGEAARRWCAMCSGCMWNSRSMPCPHSFGTTTAFGCEHSACPMAAGMTLSGRPGVHASIAAASTSLVAFRRSRLEYSSVGTLAAPWHRVETLDMESESAHRRGSGAARGKCDKRRRRRSRWRASRPLWPGRRARVARSDSAPRGTPRRSLINTHGAWKSPVVERRWVLSVLEAERVHEGVKLLSCQSRLYLSPHSSRTEETRLHVCSSCCTCKMSEESEKMAEDGETCCHSHQFGQNVEV